MAVQSTVFGKRQEPHTVIIARGNSIRHFTVRPWMAALAGSVVAAVTLGYFAATTYLVFRDDLIGAAIARQARMQHAYEDRISALREQVDRITSRQLLDQQLMETKVTELLSRQSRLSERHGRLGPLLEKANAVTVTPDTAPLPGGRPDERADAAGSKPALPALAYAGAAAPFPLRTTHVGESPADRADKLFVSINQSLRSIEKEQISRISSLADDAYQTADRIADVLDDAGLPIDVDFGKSAMGGPLVAIDNAQIFDSKVKELDQALDTLDSVKKRAMRLPIANPAPGRSISSTFGVRKDPFLGTPALHSGMDFRAPIGFPAKATASGVVTHAAWNGGYGRMVEIDHGNGYSTRFAHLSRIRVAEGQTVETGDVVGEVGSSGRSTGPHMHYEIRRNGEAIDPLRFIKVGKKLGQLL
ncbi:M23 family metallopeptidase [Kumtagia ephedrae]|uniref:Peptidase n=1 Tax=Kumtagia ephedrae TaxID=2116701 RepID=A0A2P7RXS2_9HYPH|nr:M23 family metallopeptidase [Mesorhizobium ephedrae]PSJ55001.1 peptidase [Mesorhizobium ephedrae]